MQYFTIQARSNREAIEKMKSSYGEDARILTHRSVRMGGFLGMFSAEGVEVTGYLSEDGNRKKKADVEEEKKKILEQVKKEQTLQVLLKEIQGLRESLESRTVPPPRRPRMRIPRSARSMICSPPTSFPRSSSRPSMKERARSFPLKPSRTTGSCRARSSAG